MGVTVVLQNHTISELMQFIRDNGIQFIRLAFCDIFGVQKNISIMSSQLPQAFERGVSFDASAIAGFANVAESDLFLFPDLETFSLLPWRSSQGCVGRFFCDIRRPDGSPFEGDSRSLLQRTVARAEGMGYTFQFGPECEFYLFQTDEQGRPTRVPHDQAGYFDIAPVDRGEDFRRELCLTLEEMGIQPERSHHEQGPGQNEIDFRCSSPLQAADNLMALRSAVKAIAAQHGLYASFLPKPIANQSGSGLHINLSLHHQGENLFQGFQRSASPQAASFLAGVLRRMGEITAFANPLPSSYRRLGLYEAPSAVTWSCQNRSQLVRVPAASGPDCRMEVRSPDPACNPYLTVALLLEAGLEGLRDRLPLSPPADFDLYSATPSQKEHLSFLPRSLTEALELAEASAFVREMMPPAMLENYLAHKRREAWQYDSGEEGYEQELAHFFERV